MVILLSSAIRYYNNILVEREKNLFPNDYAWNIFNYHFDNNQFYRNWIKDKPINWENIPIIKKEDLSGNWLKKFLILMKNFISLIPQVRPVYL